MQKCIEVMIWPLIPLMFNDFSRLEQKQMQPMFTITRSVRDTGIIAKMKPGNKKQTDKHTQLVSTASK